MFRMQRTGTHRGYKFSPARALLEQPLERCAFDLERFPDYFHRGVG